MTVQSRKPAFITFTGADDHTDVAGMAALSANYPIEWGILFAPARQGVDPRYPGEAALARIAASGLLLSAHLCGGYSRAIMQQRAVSVPIDLGVFSRIQVNHAAPDPRRIAAFGAALGKRCIAQARRGLFPDDTAIDWLFDTSGGRGREAPVMPPYPGRMVGYAGGIGPDNVASVIGRIDAAGPYWIDMESKVRTDDRFDLSLCRTVCEAVYG